MLACSMPSHAETPAPITYPEAPRSDVTDTLHGTPIPDPYRWLEDLDSPETTAWVKAQQTLTESYLAQIPERETLKKRLTKLLTPGGLRGLLCQKRVLKEPLQQLVVGLFHT